MIGSVSETISPYVFSSEELRSLHDQRGLPRRVTDFVLSLLRQFCYLVSAGCFFLTMKIDSQEVESWKESSQGLVVMLHGLNNHPVHLHKQIQLLEQEEDLDLYTPVVKDRGTCSLNEAVEPIFKKVLDYVRKHPGKPICLIGVSNGARLTTWIETELRKQARGTPVRVSNIAGAHFGSSLLTLAKRLKISPLVVSKVVREELSYGSDRAKELISRAQAPLPWFHGNRSFEYYATTEDLVVSDLNSTLPKIGKEAKHHVVHGQSHDSIVGAVANEQIQSCVSWMHDQKPSVKGKILALVG